MCVVDTPVPVEPSPKSQAYDEIVPGAVSVEPDASTVQVAVGQLTVNEATGATLGLTVWSACRTTVHIVALAVETAPVAVRDVVAPTPEGAFASEATEVIRPAPVPRATERWVCPAGTVQPVTSEADLSAQYETTYEPAVATVEAGVECVARFTVSLADAKAETGSAAVPSYARRVSADLVVSAKVTAALRPASLATATLV